jgi:hypothetical protein
MMTIRKGRSRSSATLPADHREQGEADRVENKKDVAQPMHHARDRDRDSAAPAVTKRV